MERSWWARTKVISGVQVVHELETPGPGAEPHLDQHVRLVKSYIGVIHAEDGNTVIMGKSFHSNEHKSLWMG